MKYKILPILSLASCLLWSSSAFSLPIAIDTAATGSSKAGDSFFHPLDLTGVLETDTDHKTDLFDVMTFGIEPDKDLTLADRGDIDMLRLNGSPLLSFGANELITLFPGLIDLYVTWDNSVTTLGNIKYWFSDTNDTNGLADTLVASGAITHLSATRLTADIDFLYNGFWLNQYGNIMTASQIDPFKIAMSLDRFENAVSIRAVPEPSILALFAIGLLSLGSKRHQKQIKA